MSGTVHTFPGGEPEQKLAPQPNAAPILPIEGHIVAAALKAERLRALSEQLLLVLQYAPRDAHTFDRVQDEALAAWCEMADHYRAYQAVLDCKGQA